MFFLPFFFLHRLGRRKQLALRQTIHSTRMHSITSQIQSNSSIVYFENIRCSSSDRKVFFRYVNKQNKSVMTTFARFWTRRLSIFLILLLSTWWVVFLKI